ncbi:MAG: GTP-binding protein [Tissierellia bacterium]|nr:GTP-binding protein [Tissierellia bacterium]
MDILLLSGFLGAGKTTFLQHLGKHLPDYCILENDYAKANVDRTLLSKTNKDIYSLEDGCICCSKQTDFADSVLTISGTVDPPYLVIEPTGLGYLSKIIENIKPIQYDNIHLLDPITIVDYFTIDETIKKYGDLFWDQVKNAGHILLSKTEHVSSENIDKAIGKIAPHIRGRVYKDHYSFFSKEDWNQILTPYDPQGFISSNGPNMSMETLVFENVVFHDFQALGVTLQAISENRFGTVIRGKGLCKVASYIAKIDLVQGKWNITPADDLEETQLVFVGENLDKNAFSILMQRK